MVDTSICIFNELYGKDCDSQRDKCFTCGPARVESIINASEVYNDALFTNLSTSTNPIYYHKKCVSRYTSKTNLKKYKPVRKSDVEAVSPKRTRRDSQSFDFEQNCLYCGEICKTIKDNRNPSRWRPASVVQSTHSGQTQQPHKEYIIDKCKERKDKWADEVMHRVCGTVSDLYAAKARYHRDCMSSFFQNRYLQFSNKITNDSGLIRLDSALNDVIRIVSANKNRIWNSIEVFKEYTDRFGTALTRKGLVSELERHFEGELLILSSPGIACILTFRSCTAHKLNIIKDDDDDNIQKAIAVISKQVNNECKQIVRDRSCYNTQINKEVISESVSYTLQLLLGALSPNLNDTLPSLLIGNIVTSQINNTITDLQIALGILLGNSKELVSNFYDFKVSCSYDEILRFKKSAAVNAADDLCQQGITNAESGLVQIVVDNFDADIASLNGKVSTHSLAMIIMQPASEDGVEVVDTIKRLKKTELNQPLETDTPTLLVYNGTKQPVMPDLPAMCLSDEYIDSQNVSKRRSDQNDFAFLQDIIKHDKCPEFNGYNTQLCRDQGHCLRPKTKIVYMPMIDLPPADPSTMLTALVKAQKISLDVGQRYVVFTCDQQLYRIALQVMWDNPGKFDNVLLRLGGMHLLMSFVGCVGSLMSDSGIEDILSSTFGAVSKMLSGKKYPQNVRALRLLTEELLRPVFLENNLTSMEDLQQILEDIALHSRTSKMWIDCVIKPVLLMQQYIRAEREADWALHLSAVQEMLPFFYAAGHVNYARYALYYLKTMQDLPQTIKEKFIKGEHTMHHCPGIFNGIWSDMAIESTYMRYGKSKDGIVGITLKPETLKTWAYSRHACSNIRNQINEMRNKISADAQSTHKEESPARIQQDSQDRTKLRHKLELCINPLKPDQHTDGIINIATGQVINHPAINIDAAYELGKTAMEAFEQSLPGGFYKTIPKVVNTIGTLRKHIKDKESKIINTELIYARAMALQNSDREIEPQKLLSYELSSVPTSMFNEEGQMRPATTKSILKNALKVETSKRLSEVTLDAIFLDGCAVLWIIPWPTGPASVQDYIDRFRSYIDGQLKISNVYLVFDRYIKSSTKEHLRHTRDKAASRTYSLNKKSRLPPKNVVLTVVTNKAQLIRLIFQDLVDHHDKVQKHTLYVTGLDPVPIQIKHGHLTHRNDMATTQEEADTIIIQQLSHVTGGTAVVMADDTDIFLLLLHFCYSKDIVCRVFMKSTSSGYEVIDIAATVQKQEDIIPCILAVHALTGCDTVACSFGIGKATGLKVLRSGKYDLNMLGNISNNISSFSRVLDQATRFMLACYGQSTCGSLTEARQKTWTEKVGKKKACAPAIASLPPTDESFKQNVMRAHLQVATWLHALHMHPPPLKPTDYGWTKEEFSDALTPTTVESDIALVPQEILKLIRCSCKSQIPCNTARCSCKKSNMPCTVFCSCKGNCQNAPEDDEDD